MTTEQPDQPGPAWILIERQYGDPLLIGPYPDEQVATHAMDHALLIDGFCEEDCLDCYTVTSPPSYAHECVVIDPGNPDHTGAPAAVTGTGALRICSWQYEEHKAGN